MKVKSMIAAAATLAAAGASQNAHALVFCVQSGSSCVSTDSNIVLNRNNIASAIVTGVTNGPTAGVGFTFTSPAAVGETIAAPANGQARITPSDGILNGLTLAIDPAYTFTAAEFALNALNPGSGGLRADSILVNFITTAGVISRTVTGIPQTGNPFFGVVADPGELLTGISFVANPLTDGFADVRQIRVGGVAAVVPVAPVPEPETWALMIAGLGTAGTALRRRRRRMAPAALLTA